MKFGNARCETCSKTIDACRSVCSSLQPMITLLLECKSKSTSGMERSVIEDIIKVLSIIELERDMAKAIKRVKEIYG